MFPWKVLCLSLWRKARQVQVKTVDSYRRHANKHQKPAPSYRAGQKVWLSTSGLPLCVDNKKLAPCLVGPCSVAGLINPFICETWITQAHAVFFVFKTKLFVFFLILDAFKTLLTHLT